REGRGGSGSCDPLARGALRDSGARCRLAGVSLPRDTEMADGTRVKERRGEIEVEVEVVKALVEERPTTVARRRACERVRGAGDEREREQCRERDAPERP